MSGVSQVPSDKELAGLRADVAEIGDGLQRGGKSNPEREEPSRGGDSDRQFMPIPLVSVIVPVYKVEPYLRRCVDSILAQTYANLEIILVDDGSPDNCPRICDEYAARDHRIVVIHKENGGLSDARNAGLDVACGEYVLFTDSDDWLDARCVEKLYLLARAEDAEIVLGSFSFVYEDGREENLSPFHSRMEVLDRHQALAKLFTYDEIVFVVAWGKLFKRALFDGIRFPKGKLYEDEYVAYKLLRASRKTVFRDTPLYKYFQRGDSIMAVAGGDSLRRLEAHLERYRFFKKNGEKELCELCNESLCWDLLFAYDRMKNGHPVTGFESAADVLSNYREMVGDYLARAPKGPHKFYLKFFAKHPHAYLLYRKMSPCKIRKD